MVAAPNITTEAVPTHLIRQLLSRYRTELDVSTQGDDPYAAAPTPGGGGMRLLEEDDYHFQTRQINIIAKERKSSIQFSARTYVFGKGHAKKICAKPVGRQGGGKLLSYSAQVALQTASIGRPAGVAKISDGSCKTRPAR